MAPLSYTPTTHFDACLHKLDTVAQVYLSKCNLSNLLDLIPIESIGDGNCLYNSILTLMPSPSEIIAEELRVRAIVELAMNYNYYNIKYERIVGPLNLRIKAMCENYEFSELFEIDALSNILQCQIQSVYPRIQYHPYFDTPEKNTNKNNQQKSVRIPQFTPPPSNRTFQQQTTSDIQTLAWNQSRQDKHRERMCLSRENEDDNQYAKRTEQNRKHMNILRQNEDDDQYAKRTQEDRERKRVSRAQETELEHRMRILNMEQRACWPVAVPRELKLHCLQNFVENMSMSRKPTIPKFSVANKMWIGTIPEEPEDLTIPEQKLIALYRHNSCVIKLQTPFHDTSAAQGALKGNVISFPQNVSNTATTLPLSLAYLCDTIKIIFVGSKRPKPEHLKKVLTVRRKKFFDSLTWLKSNNELYKYITIDMKNINELPENDVPQPLLDTMHYTTEQEAANSEREDYVVDPLSADSVQLEQPNINVDDVPFSASALVDVNATNVSSDEINYHLKKMYANDNNIPLKTRYHKWTQYQ
ncbi:unnamed protein product [Didymodactylos carnosus]|uniref:OTU domain-containing protein n=2 Tax=Didymodactylos carnosus TaxID=1234261 RepID=A0A8S2E353_9BILA|nr:unnamed protein product [Didymodactylos carnosus]CAF3894405.1 unnamed protein product [Didymodactylos carnosus]